MGFEKFLKVAAIVVLVIAVATIGHGKPKTTIEASNHDGPSYSHYRHMRVGVECDDCHNFMEGVLGKPSNEKCLGCHQSYKNKTSNLKPNPHAGHHYEDAVSCSVCHKIHGTYTNFCNGCHNFEW